MSYMRGLIFILSGPSGSGKTTLRKKLLLKRSLKDNLLKVTSFTTRAPRQGEKQGRDYFFISEEEFIQRRRKGEFLEWTKYLRHYYGTPKRPIQEMLRCGKDLVLCLDTKGALRVKNLYPDNVVLIFILPPSLRVLKTRLKKRARTEYKSELIGRLNIIQEEIAQAEKYNYLVTNDSLSESLKILSAIIIAARSRVPKLRYFNLSSYYATCYK